MAVLFSSLFGVVMLKRPKFILNGKLTDVGRAFDAVARKHDGHWDDAFVEWADEAKARFNAVPQRDAVSMRNAYRSMCRKLGLKGPGYRGSYNRPKRHPVVTSKVTQVQARAKQPIPSHSNGNVGASVIERASQIVAERVLKQMGF